MQNLFNKKSFISLFFLTILLIIFSRGPCWLIEGSLKQDALTFYLDGKSKDFLENLFHVYPHTGALMFWSNITNSIITLFPINKAKLLANYLTLVVYLTIFIYIYFTKSTLFTNYKYKIFAIFVILLSPPMTPEVWMSFAHLRGYFGIFSFILLFHDFKNEKKVVNSITNFLVFFSGICSIYAAALTPAYFFKYYLNKSKNDLYRFLSALSAFFIQSILIVNYIFLNFSETRRFHLQLDTFYSYFYNVPIRSFFGSYIPKSLFVNTEIYKIQYFNFFIYFLLISVFLALLSYLIKKNDKISFTMFLCLILVSSLIIVGSFQPGFVGGRYAVVPGVITIFIIFRFYLIEKNLFLKNLFFILLASSLITGSLEYKYISPLPNLLECTDSDQQIYQTK
tara:strand:+ start:52 stop:1236 length:1185 start_codon:yes stop_codon:yes gene_type:complete